MRNVLVLLKNGFEEIEALTVVDYLRRADIKVDMVSTQDELTIQGAHGIKVEANIMLSDVISEDVDLLYIPGGMPGALDLKNDPRVVDLVKEIDKRGRIVAAICAGPIVLEEAGVIEGKEVTSFPGFEGQLPSIGKYSEELVVVDENIVTSRGPATAVYMALQIIELLKGSKVRESIAKDIQLDKVEQKIGMKDA